MNRVRNTCPLYGEGTAKKVFRYNGLGGSPLACLLLPFVGSMYRFGLSLVVSLVVLTVTFPSHLFAQGDWRRWKRSTKETSVIPAKDAFPTPRDQVIQILLSSWWGEQTSKLRTLSTQEQRREAVKQLFDVPELRQMVMEEVGRTGWEETVKEEARTRAERKAERKIRIEAKVQKLASATPFHVAQTFLLISTIAAMASVDAVRELERAAGESSGYSAFEISKIAGDAVINDPTIWGGLTSGGGVSAALQSPLRQIDTAIQTQVNQRILGSILRSTVGTTVLFFGWELGRALVHMACHLDARDITVPGGSPKPLTTKQANEFKTGFLKLFGKMILSRMPPNLSMSEEARAMSVMTKEEGDDAVRLFGQVFQNMFYILFVNDDLRALWFDVAMRLGLFTGETFLIMAALSASSLVGGAVGTAIQPFVPIPGTTLIVGFMFVVAGGYLAYKLPPEVHEAVGEEIWGFREAWQEGREGDAFDRLALGLQGKRIFGVYPCGFSRRCWIETALSDLRKARQGKATLLLEKLNADWKQLTILSDYNRTASETIRATLAGERTLEKSELLFLQGEVAKKSRKVDEYLDRVRVNRDLLKKVYSEQAEALETVLAWGKGNRFVPDATSITHAGAETLLEEEYTSLTTMNEMLIEIVDALDHIDRFTTIPFEEVDEETTDQFNTAIMMLSVMVYRRVDEAGLTTMVNDVLDRLGRSIPADQFSGY